MADVLVGDDDPDYRLLVAVALEGAPDLRLVGEAASADDLVEVAARCQPDVVLLDASLPGGVPAAIRLHDRVPESRIVLTSSLPARSIATTVAAAHAVGSLAKDVPVRRIPHALREIAAFVTVAERAVRTASTALTVDRMSPRHSRQLARLALTGWCDDEVLASIELLVSELVANGVEHAATKVDVRIAVGATMVRVEVTDRSPELPVMRTPQVDSPNGRGMRIVDTAASRWGVQARRTGKSVWFEVPRYDRIATG
jgi:DNA-binding NarL/FixJ family response regulator